MEITGLTVAVLRDDDGQVLEAIVCDDETTADLIVRGVNGVDSGDRASVVGTSVPVLTSASARAYVVGLIADAFDVRPERLLELAAMSYDEDGWPIGVVLTEQEHFALPATNEALEAMASGT